MPKSPHILQLTENTLGCDYVIGDVHGSSIFFEVIAKLKEQDRLFIVGDLIDRGDQNVEVVKKIIEINKNGQKIFVARGNHENLFLNACDFNLQREPDSLYSELSDEKKSELEENFKSYISSVNGGRWIISTPPEDLKLIRDYFKSLPYIILAGDFQKKENAFLVCHADMPFSDAELETRLSLPQNPFLNEQEINYVTWARPLEFLNNRSNRSEKSIICYCGHNPTTREMNLHAAAVRYETNTINLDVMTYHINAFALLNHTKKCVESVGIPVNDFEKKVTDVVTILNDYLRDPDAYRDYLKNLKCDVIFLDKLESAQKITAPSTSSFLGQFFLSQLYASVSPILISSVSKILKKVKTDVLVWAPRLSTEKLLLSYITGKKAELLIEMSTLKKQYVNENDLKFLGEIENVILGKLGSGFVNVSKPCSEKDADNSGFNPEFDLVAPADFDEVAPPPKPK